MSIRGIDMIDDYDEYDDLGRIASQQGHASLRSSAESVQPNIFSDDTSLAYSVDTRMSKLSSFPPAPQDDEMSALDGPDHYFSQDYPTITPRIVPAPTPSPVPPPSIPAPFTPPVEPEDDTPWYQAPFEYIFGGDDDDDDVSTIYGGFNEFFNVDPPPSTKRQSIAEQTIYEEEYESESASQSQRSSHSNIFPSRESVAYTARDAETIATESKPSSFRSKVDLDDATADIDTASIAAPAAAPAAPYSEQSFRAPSSRRSIWTEEKSGDEILKSRAGRFAKSASWRSSRSMAYPSDATYRSTRSLGTTKTTRSALPLEAQIVKFGEGGPMMTKGMSGRAVVHVNMAHSQDGKIQSLQYSMPLVPAADLGFKDEEDGFDDKSWDDASGIMGNKELSSMYDYYFYKNRLIRLCYSRKCYRMNALLILCFAVILTFVFSIMAIIDESNDSALNRSSDGQRGASLSDALAPPELLATIPSVIDKNIADWYHEDGNYALKPEDVPFFFHIPMAGALIAADVWGSCFGFTIASDVGRVEATSDSLKSIQVFGLPYINVDTTTTKGIAHAKKMNLVPSGLPDIVISPLFQEVVKELYSPKTTAKLVVTFRDPIQRAVAMFHYKTKIPGTAAYDPKLSAMTLEEFALSPYVQNNYMTRLLTNKPGGALTRNDFTLAKEILRRKAVVGLYDNLEISIQHINTYFSWTPISGGATECQTKLINDNLTKETMARLDSGSTAHSLLGQQNQFDTQLFDYVRVALIPYQYAMLKMQKEGTATTENS